MFGQSLHLKFQESFFTVLLSGVYKAYPCYSFEWSRPSMNVQNSRALTDTCDINSSFFGSFGIAETFGQQSVVLARPSRDNSLPTRRRQLVFTRRSVIEVFVIIIAAIVVRFCAFLNLTPFYIGPMDSLVLLVVFVVIAASRLPWSLSSNRFHRGTCRAVVAGKL